MLGKEGRRWNVCGTRLRQSVIVHAYYYLRLLLPTSPTTYASYYPRLLLPTLTTTNVSYYLRLLPTPTTYASCNLRLLLPTSPMPPTTYDYYYPRLLCLLQPTLTTTHVSYIYRMLPRITHGNFVYKYTHTPSVHTHAHRRDTTQAHIRHWQTM